MYVKYGTELEYLSDYFNLINLINNLSYLQKLHIQLLNSGPAQLLCVNRLHRTLHSEFFCILRKNLLEEHTIVSATLESSAFCLL